MNREEQERSAENSPESVSSAFPDGGSAGLSRRAVLTTIGAAGLAAAAGSVMAVTGASAHSVLKSVYAPGGNNVHASDRIDVLAYGAVGDGTTDDTEAIQAAVDAAGGDGCCTVYFPEGVYKVSGKIVLHDRLHLIGYCAKLVQTAVNTPILEGDGVSRIRIEELAFEGLGTDFVETFGRNARGISILGTNAPSSQIRIERCRFERFTASGVWLDNTDGFHVTGNRVVGTFSYNADEGKNHQFGILVRNSSKNGWLEHNEVSKTAHGIYLGKDYENVGLHHNLVTDIVGQHGFYLNYGFNLQCTGNIVRKVNLQGIKLQIDANGTYDANRVLIAGNLIDQAVSHGILMTNTVSGSPYYYLNAIISGNVIVCGDSSNGAGIYLNKNKGCIVSGNIVVKGWYGIMIKDSYEVAVESNRISLTQKNGLFMSDSGGLKFRGNEIVNCGQGAGTTNKEGIHVATDGEVGFDGDSVRDDSGLMTYALLTSSLVSGARLSARNMILSDKPTRFSPATVSLKEFHNNKVASFYGNAYPAAVIEGRKNRVFHGAVAHAPVTGAGYRIGDRYEYSDPAAAGYIGRVHTANGWKEFGAIAP